MASTAPLPDEIRDAAARWYAVHRSDNASEAERRALDDWLTADPRHAEAFARLDRTAAHVAALKSLADLEPLDDEILHAEGDEEAEAAPTPSPVVVPLRRPWLRRAAAVTALAASLAAAAILGPDMLSAPDFTVETRVGEQRVLRLADGSRITLGPASRLEVRYGPDRRRVELAAGEAFFDVARDPARPFQVAAGDTQVQVLGTRFNVNRGAGRVRVAVLEGVVRIQAPKPLLSTAPAPARVLRAAQRIEAPAEAPILAVAPPPAPPVTQSPVPAGDWRHGRLTYADARLADVVADLNRYYAPGVRLADPDLADTRIAAALRPDEIESFLEGLPLIADLRVRRGEHGEVLIVAKEG